MPDFVTLTCPTCGGKLEITNEIERFACGYCGHEHIVKRGGGIISISPIADDVKGIRVSADKTAAELGLVRLSKELEPLKVMREELLEEFYLKYFNLNRKRYAYLDLNIYYFIKSLLVRIDQKNITHDKEEKYILFKNRILSLTIKDLDYLIDKAIDEAVNPIEREKYIGTIKIFSKLKLELVELDTKIQNIEAEISRLRGIVSGVD